MKVYLFQQKTITCYPNNKPWVTKDMKTTAKQEKSWPFLNMSMGRLKKLTKQIKNETKKCKKEFKNKIEQSFVTNDIKSTWTRLRQITGYATKKAMR